MEMENTTTWGEYGKLVLKELERLNEGQELMKTDINIKLEKINMVLNGFKNTEHLVVEQKNWIDKVSEVWSPTQMKEAKDEIYKQKGKWIATIAILGFIQILLGILAIFIKG